MGSRRLVSHSTLGTLPTSSGFHVYQNPPMTYYNPPLDIDSIHPVSYLTHDAGNRYLKEIESPFIFLT